MTDVDMKIAALLAAQGDLDPNQDMFKPKPRARSLVEALGSTGLGGFGPALEDYSPDEQKQMAADNAKLLADLSGVTSVREGAGNIQRGVEDGSAMRGAQGLGQMVLGVAPAGLGFKAGRAVLGAVSGSIPRATGFSIATMLPGAILESTEAAAQSDTRQRLQSMSPAELKAYQKQIGVVPDGKLGPDTLAKAMADDAQKQAMAKVIAGGDAEAKVASAKAEAEGRARIAEQEAAAARAKQEKAEATSKPVRELYPEVMPFAPLASMILGGAAGSFVKSRAGSVFNKEMSDLSTRWKAATDRGDLAAADALKKEFDAVRGAGPKGDLAALTAGSTVGAELGLLPDEIDAWRGVANAKDLPAVLGRGAVGGLMGGLPAMTGAKITGAAQKAYHPAYNAETESLRAGGRAAPSTGPLGGPQGGPAGPSGGPSTQRGPAPQPGMRPYDETLDRDTAREALRDLLAANQGSKQGVNNSLKFAQDLESDIVNRTAQKGRTPIDPAELTFRARGTMRDLGPINDAAGAGGYTVTSPKVREAAVRGSTGKMDTLAVPLTAGAAGLAAYGLSPDQAAAAPVDRLQATKTIYEALRKEGFPQDVIIKQIKGMSDQDMAGIIAGLSR